jgi:hypothetical protein
MKHASQAALDRLEPLLGKIRSQTLLKEKSRGCFYFRSRGFLHFHEHGDAFFADVKLGQDFERLPATTGKDWKALLQTIDGALAVQGHGSGR